MSSVQARRELAQAHRIDILKALARASADGGGACLGDILLHLHSHDADHARRQIKYLVRDGLAITISEPFKPGIWKLTTKGDLEVAQYLPPVKKKAKRKKK